MSLETLVLFLIVGVALVGVMVAVNAEGPTKSVVSYIIAMLLVGGTGYAIITVMSHKKSIDEMEAYESSDSERLKKLESAAKKRREEAQVRRNGLRSNKKIVELAQTAQQYGQQILNSRLKNFNEEIDVKIYRAKKMINDVNDLEKEFKSLIVQDSEEYQTMEEALQELKNAAKYYKLYFYSENATEESLRESRLKKYASRATALLATLK